MTPPLWQMFYDDRKCRDWRPIRAATLDEARELGAKELGYTNHAELVSEGWPVLDMRQVNEDDEARPLACPRCDGMGVLATGYYGEEPECPACGGSGEWYPWDEDAEPLCFDEGGTA
jgi:hypothetical protein